MSAIPQLRNDGSLRHLLTLEGLPRALIERLLERSGQQPPAARRSPAGPSP
jgi:hypothetical protein